MLAQGSALLALLLCVLLYHMLRSVGLGHTVTCD